jgi:type VI secretion system secreted protein VgrG
MDGSVPAVPKTPSVPDGVPGAPRPPGVPSAPSAPSKPALSSIANAAKAVAPVIAEAAPTIAKVAKAVPTLARIAESAEAVLSSFGTGAKALPPVRYAFTYEGDTQWSVARIFHTERLNEPYQLHVDLVTDDLDADTDAMLGRSCILDIERDPQRRSVHGVITRLDVLAMTRGQLHVALFISPAVALLDQRIRSRTFQDVRVPPILSVLGTYIEPYGRSVRFHLDEEYEPRDYCVQFRESDLRFFQRIMQEEGIAFYFEHDDDEAKEILVVVDDNRHFPKFSEEPIPFLDVQEAFAEQETIQGFQLRQSLRPTEYFRRDFDHRVPKEPIEHRVELDERYWRGVYEHSDRRYINDDGAALAQRRFEQLRMDAKLFVGRSNVTGLSAGHIFELEGHPLPDLDGRYLVIAVDHFGDAAEVVLDSAATDRQADYRNQFRCIPADVPYRPAPVIPRPRLHGDLTGTVCGPAESEVHTDEEGRIKVAMHWDVEGTRDENASCWIRIRHAWAGPEYGAFCLPRVGMEVLVSFLDGNPDRPLVTGCVYNGDNRPPLTLPGEKTRTTLRTSSSPGGDGFNELRIEDAAGCEEIYVHAQKDFNATVLNACSWDVGAGRSVSVGGNNSINVTGNYEMYVDGQGGGDSPGSSTTVNGHYSVHAEQTISISAVESITLTVGDSSIHITPELIKAIAGKAAFVNLDDTVRAESAEGSWMLLTENAGVHAKAGGFLAMTSDVLLQAKDEANVRLAENAAMTGKQTDCVSTEGATLVLTADAALFGATTTCAAEGGGAAKFEKAGATVAGKTTTVLGESEVKINGALINIG